MLGNLCPWFWYFPSRARIRPLFRVLSGHLDTNQNGATTELEDNEQNTHCLAAIIPNLMYRLRKIQDQIRLSCIVSLCCWSWLESLLSTYSIQWWSTETAGELRETGGVCGPSCECRSRRMGPLLSSDMVPHSFIVGIDCLKSWGRSLVRWLHLHYVGTRCTVCNSAE